MSCDIWCRCFPYVIPFKLFHYVLTQRTKHDKYIYKSCFLVQSIVFTNCDLSILHVKCAALVIGWVACKSKATADVKSKCKHVKMQSLHYGTWIKPFTMGRNTSSGRAWHGLVHCLLSTRESFAVYSASHIPEKIKNPLH